MKNLKRILEFARPYKSLGILNIIGNVFSVIFTLITFLILGKVIKVLFQREKEILEPLAENADIMEQGKYMFEEIMYTYISNNDSYEVLVRITLVLVVSFFFKNVFRYFAQYFLAPLRSNILRDLRGALHHKITKLPISYFTEKHKGDLITRVTADVVEVEWSVISLLELIVRDPFTILTSVISMIIISPELTLFVFVFLPIAGFIVARVGKALKTISNEGQQKVSTLVSILEENLSAIKIIKAFNAERKVNNRFDEVNDEYTVINNKLTRRKDLASPMSEFLGAVIICVVFWYGGKLIINNTDSALDPDYFIAYIGLFYNLLAPIKNLSQAYNKLQKGMASIDRIVEVLDAKEEVDDQENALPFLAFQNKIDFKNINFSYTEDIPVLKNVTFTIQKGETVALVGQSGSGKSTIADLLSRYYDVNSGSIEFDGKNLNDLKIVDVRNHLGIITQESLLFNDTVMKNLTLGVDNYTTEQVRRAAENANALDFIEKLEFGFDTIVGDRGSKLSGGQRQRLSIARALITDPDIMIMDEATSALDTESERLVQNALDSLLKDRTSLVIAHRLSTVIKADKIIVLHEGEIVEMGTHSELMNLNKYYKKLHEMQDIT